VSHRPTTSTVRAKRLEELYRELLRTADDLGATQAELVTAALAVVVEAWLQGKSARGFSERKQFKAFALETLKRIDAVAQVVH
jgi:hypothetical protein